MRSKQIVSALFCHNNLKSYKSKGLLFDCSQIWTIASLTYKKQKRVCKFYSAIYFFKSEFCTITPYFFNRISKMFCNFSLKLKMANPLHDFLALWSRKRRKTLNNRKTKFASTCNVHKVIRALAFSSREKFDNSFYPFFFCYSLIASAISYNLI